MASRGARQEEVDDNEFRCVHVKKWDDDGLGGCGRSRGMDTFVSHGGMTG